MANANLTTSAIDPASAYAKARQDYLRSLAAHHGYCAEKLSSAIFVEECSDSFSAANNRRLADLRSALDYVRTGGQR